MKRQKKRRSKDYARADVLRATYNSLGHRKLLALSPSNIMAGTNTYNFSDIEFFDTDTLHKVHEFNFDQEEFTSIDELAFCAGENNLAFKLNIGLNKEEDIVGLLDCATDRIIEQKKVTIEKQFSTHWHSASPSLVEIFGERLFTPWYRYEVNTLSRRPRKWQVSLINDVKTIEGPQSGEVSNDRCSWGIGRDWTRPPICSSKDGEYVAISCVISDNPKVYAYQLWKSPFREPLRICPLGYYKPTHFLTDRRFRLMFIGYQNLTIEARFISGELIGRFNLRYNRPSYNPKQRLCFSEDLRFLVSCNKWESEIQLWDLNEILEDAESVGSR